MQFTSGILIFGSAPSKGKKATLRKITGEIWKSDVCFHGSQHNIIYFDKLLAFVYLFKLLIYLFLHT